MKNPRLKKIQGNPSLPTKLNLITYKPEKENHAAEEGTKPLGKDVEKEIEEKEDGRKSSPTLKEKKGEEE